MARDLLVRDDIGAVWVEDLVPYTQAARCHTHREVFAAVNTLRPGDLS